MWNAVTICRATSSKIGFTVLLYYVSWYSKTYVFFCYEGWIKRSNFTVPVTGELFVISWTVADLTALHKMEQMLLRSVSFIWNTFLCVEYLTKYCENRMYCAVLYVGCVCIQRTLKHWQCDSTVLDKLFVLFGRVMVPSSSGSSGVWLDTEMTALVSRQHGVLSQRAWPYPQSHSVSWILLQPTFYSSVSYL
jgi:hypothetical protein